MLVYLCLIYCYYGTCPHTSFRQPTYMYLFHVSSFYSNPHCTNSHRSKFHDLDHLSYPSSSCRYKTFSKICAGHLTHAIGFTCTLQSSTTRLRLAYGLVRLPYRAKSAPRTSSHLRRRSSPIHAAFHSMTTGPCRHHRSRIQPVAWILLLCDLVVMGA